ncbi:hypothetical protein PR048_017697 [Dryococelus australis]|uniref:Uncharacterized protein n=1 Tax=Dryococelus australis TaxID=614101 RepID=A0ABQ9HA99_9NEOP|nr:hypothetical protein PR048_017697 [Dryococelus australis]
MRFPAPGFLCPVVSLTSEKRDELVVACNCGDVRSVRQAAPKQRVVDFQMGRSFPEIMSGINAVVECRHEYRRFTSCKQASSRLQRWDAGWKTGMEFEYVVAGRNRYRVLSELDETSQAGDREDLHVRLVVLSGRTCSPFAVSSISSKALLKSYFQDIPPPHANKSLVMSGKLGFIKEGQLTVFLCARQNRVPSVSQRARIPTSYKSRRIVTYCLVFHTNPSILLARLVAMCGTKLAGQVLAPLLPSPDAVPFHSTRINSRQPAESSSEVVRQLRMFQHLWIAPSLPALIVGLPLADARSHLQLSHPGSRRHDRPPREPEPESSALFTGCSLDFVEPVQFFTQFPNERLSFPQETANRARFPAGSPAFPHEPDVAGGFSRDSPVYPALAFRRCSIFTSSYRHRRLRTRCQKPAKTSQLNLPFFALVMYGSSARPLLNYQEDCNVAQARVKLAELLRECALVLNKRGNGRAGKTGYRRKNSPTSGIVRHDSHLRKSGELTGRGLNPFRLSGRRSLSARLPWPPSGFKCGEELNLLIGWEDKTDLVLYQLYTTSQSFSAMQRPFQIRVCILQVPCSKSRHGRVGLMEQSETHNNPSRSLLFNQSQGNFFSIRPSVKYLPNFNFRRTDESPHSDEIPQTIWERAFASEWLLHVTKRWQVASEFSRALIGERRYNILLASEATLLAALSWLDDFKCQVPQVSVGESKPFSIGSGKQSDCCYEFTDERFDHENVSKRNCRMYAVDCNINSVCMRRPVVGRDETARSWVEANFQKRECIKFIPSPRDETRRIAVNKITSQTNYISKSQRRLVMRNRHANLPKESTDDNARLIKVIRTRKILVRTGSTVSVCTGSTLSVKPTRQNSAMCHGGGSGC